MFLAVRCQHASGACRSHSCTVLSLREASQKYAYFSHSTLPLLALRFHEKDLPPAARLLRVRPILPLLRHILSKAKEAEAKSKEAKGATEVPKDPMKAAFQVDLDKAKKATEDAQGAMTAAASEMFAFYSNPLSPESKY
jgi:hypothetical protein